MTVAMSPALQALDWAGCSAGLLGAYLLAFRLKISRYGWIAFFGANLAYIVLAGELHILGLLAQQAGFVGSSVVGIYRHFFVRTKVSADTDRELAWLITSRLAGLSLRQDESASSELELLIRQARALHHHRAPSRLPRGFAGQPESEAVQ